MLAAAALTMALLTSGSQADLPEQKPLAGSGGANVEAAQVVWSYDTGG